MFISNSMTRRQKIIVAFAVLCTFWAVANTMFIVGGTLFEHRPYIIWAFQWHVAWELFHRLWAIETCWFVGMTLLYWLWATSPPGKSQLQSESS